MRIFEHEIFLPIRACCSTLLWFPIVAVVSIGILLALSKSLS